MSAWFRRAPSRARVRRDRAPNRRAAKASNPQDARQNPRAVTRSINCRLDAMHRFSAPPSCVATAAARAREASAARAWAGAGAASSGRRGGRAKQHGGRVTGERGQRAFGVRALDGAAPFRRAMFQRRTSGHPCAADIARGRTRGHASKPSLPQLVRAAISERRAPSQTPAALSIDAPSASGDGGSRSGAHDAMRRAPPRAAGRVRANSALRTAAAAFRSAMVRPGPARRIGRTDRRRIRPGVGASLGRPRATRSRREAARGPDRTRARRGSARRRRMRRCGGRPRRERNRAAPRSVAAGPSRSRSFISQVAWLTSPSRRVAIRSPRTSQSESTRRRVRIGQHFLARFRVDDFAAQVRVIRGRAPGARQQDELAEFRDGRVDPLFRGQGEQARRHFVDAARQRAGLRVDQARRDASAALAEVAEKAREAGAQLIGDPDVEFLGRRVHGSAGVLRRAFGWLPFCALRLRVGRALGRRPWRAALRLFASPDAAGGSAPLRRRPIQSLTQSGTSPALKRSAVLDEHPHQRERVLAGKFARRDRCISSPGPRCRRRRDTDWRRSPGIRPRSIRRSARARGHFAGLSKRRRGCQRALVRRHRLDRAASQSHLGRFPS